MKMVCHNSGGKVRDLHFKENTNKAEKTLRITKRYLYIFSGRPVVRRIWFVPDFLHNKLDSFHYGINIPCYQTDPL